MRDMYNDTMPKQMTPAFVLFAKISPLPPSVACVQSLSEKKANAPFTKLLQLLRQASSLYPTPPQI